MATRNFDKFLHTRHYFTKKNAHIFRNPTLHASAIWAQLFSEKSSKLLEDLFMPRCVNRLEIPDGLLEKLYNGYLDPSPTDYQLEQHINTRLNIGYVDFYRAQDERRLINGTLKMRSSQQGRYALTLPKLMSIWD